MSYSRKAYESSLKAHKKLIATKLLDGIEKLYENKASERRWVWELLQNAKDVAKERVRVQIVLCSDSVEFQHNGSPFLLDNVTYLIEQVSTKERASELGEALETTGKFGTGFMTTHLLSKKVEVQGVLEDEDTEPHVYKRFTLQLNRDAATPEEMIAKVNKSYEVFDALDDELLCPQLEEYVPYQGFDTSFKYSLDRKGLRIAKVGIEDLHNALSYALIFLPKIESVTVIDETQGRSITYSTGSAQPIGSGIKLSTIEITADAETSFLKIASATNEKQTLTIAVPVQEEDNRFAVQPSHAQTPRLFCDFPLIGSEQFTFPVIFNSPLFNPNEPRDTVLLDELEDEKRQFNKALFEECLELYKRLLEHASAQWQDAYRLAHSALPERVDAQWYRTSIQQPLRQKVLNTPIVDTHTGKRIPLSQARIPYHRAFGQVLELWSLAIALHPNVLPTKEHVLGWHEIVDADWERDFKVELRYTLSDLVQDIASEHCLVQLAQRLNKSEAETVAWLNQIIAFVEQDRATNARKLLDTYPIIPNQYGKFEFLKKLSQDDGIPEEIKYVLKVLDEDWKQQLGYLGICCKFPKRLDVNKASRAIDDQIRKGRHGSLRKALYYLASCQPDAQALSQPAFARRVQVWQFAKDLDDAVPEPRTLSVWTAQLWTECDEWLLQTLVGDLVAIGTLPRLQANLQKPSEDEAAAWLSHFIRFLKQDSRWKLFYIEEAVLPNQRGQFSKKNALFFDAGIPEEIKDVLEMIEIDYRSELLDKRIQGFESDCRQRGVKEASDDIDLRLIEKGSLEDRQVREAVFSLICYLSTEEDSSRKRLWQLANTFYGDPVIGELQVIPNLALFNWTHCNSWMLKRLSLDVSAAESISSLAQHLNLEEGDAIEYLSALICFADEQQSAFIKDLKLWPNQHRFFVERKALKKDSGIDSALKDICGYLAKKDWYACLLLTHERFSSVEVLFEESETEVAKAVAEEIDCALSEYSGDRRDHNFVEALQMLFAWQGEQTDARVEKLLPYFYKNKAQLFLDICENQSIRGCIFDMLQVEPDKLEALTRLANAEDISSADIDRFVACRSDLAALEEIRSKKDMPESAGDVLKLLTTLGLEPEYLDALLDERAAQLSAVTTLQARSRTASPRRVRTYPQVISFEETTEEVLDVGFQGEEFVYRKLVAKYGGDRVVWMNEEKEGRHPYDFKILEENLKEIAFYIDAKSSRSGEHSSGSIFFSITNAQWDFLKECNNYYIAKVFRALSERPNLQLIKIDLRDELL